MQRDDIPLPSPSAGTRRHLTLWRFGTPGAVKVYLQAGLHADEMPGVLVLQHLLGLLEQAEARGDLRGEILVLPAANPLGLSQWAFQRPLGRMEADSLHNFNRGYADLAALAGDRLEQRLGPDAAQNLSTIRAAFREALAESLATARTEMTALQTTLLSLSCDADYVLDLHCDHEAILHLYASSARPEITELLCRCTGAELALLQDVSGGHAFDEAHTAPWLHLRARFGDRFPIPAGAFSTTLEYRGQFDVHDATAAADAAHLMTFLTAVGVVHGTATPAHPDARHLPLGGAAEVFAPQGGVVTWLAAPGATVREGEVLGHVTDPASRLRLPVLAPNAGVMFRRELWRSCLRGQGLAHVAGDFVLRDGDLLSD